MRNQAEDGAVREIPLQQFGQSAVVLARRRLALPRNALHAAHEQALETLGEERPAENSWGFLYPADRIPRRPRRFTASMAR